MTHRHFATALLIALFLVIGQSLSFAAECASCDRTLADCRSPIHAKYVSCMNSGNTSCGSKCAEDCKGDQKCTYNCAKTCRAGSSSCQGAFTSANTQCMNAYQSCKKGCTVAR